MVVLYPESFQKNKPALIKQRLWSTIEILIMIEQEEASWEEGIKISHIHPEQWQTW